jgi:hypothetical protein
MPEPPKDGDPVYCCDIRVGTFHGPRGGRLGGRDCYISTVPTAEMPPALRDHFSKLFSVQ